MIDLSLPTRQSKKSILFYLFKNLKGLALVALYAAFGMSSWATAGWSTVFIAGIAAVALIAPILRYYFFTFHINADELIINEGFLFKQRKSVPIDRIQSININQNVLQRLLSISSLEIETAGSSGKEIEIPALEFVFAKALKDTLKSKSTAVNEASLGTDDLANTATIENQKDAADAQEVAQEKPMVAKTVMQLDVADLFKIALTQNHLKSGGLALGVVVGFWFQIKDFVAKFIGDPFENWEEDLAQTAVTDTVRITDYLGSIVIAFVLFCIVSILVSFVLTFSKYWDFKMVHDGDNLEVQMGLFNRREVKMPLSKVQILEFHSNPLRHMLGYQTARIYQAQSQDTKSTAIEVPACKPAMVAQLQQLLFNEPLETAQHELKPNPWSYMRFSLYIMSLFLLPLLAASIYLEQLSAAVAAILIYVLTAYVSYNIGKRNAIQRGDSFVIFYKGWIFPTTIITPIYKVQAVELWRSIFIVQRQEIHFNLHTAAGSRNLKYFKEAEARALAHSIHREVLLTERSWM